MKKARSKFNLSHRHLTTCKMGQLFPILCLEAVPGDTFKIKTESLIRLQALVTPSYDNIRCKVEYFFVPSRLVWDDAESFFTGGVEGNVAPVYPTITSPAGGFGVGSLMNHLGINPKTPNMDVGALQARSLNLIYNDWYINLNVEAPRVFSTASGDDTTTDLSPMYRSWKLDRFTASLPWAQRGEPVYLPLGTAAPVRFTGNSGDIAAVKSGASPSGVGFFHVNYASGSYPVGIADSGEGSVSNLDVDLTQASAIDVDSLRAAVQMQLAKALLARGGARYIEMIQSFFGVRVPDYRLQRSEFLGGGSSFVAISEVLQTSASSTTPQGNMAGHAISYNGAPYCKYFCQEYGYLIAMCSIVPDSLYFQGVPRQFLRRTRWDEPMPIFQHLGEQEVYMKELYAQGNSVQNANGDIVDNTTFGFEGRYNDLRHLESQVTGEFTDTLKFWSLMREFDKPPALNDTFVKCHPSTRIFADENADAKDQCLLSIVHHIHAKRPFAKRAKPGYMDHYR